MKSTFKLRTAPMRMLLWVLTILWGGVLSRNNTLQAQEYKYELGGQLGTGSYLGDANAKVPFSPLGINAAGVWRYNHNFRTAFSATLGYQLTPISSSAGDNTLPGTTEGAEAQPLKGTAHLVHLQLLAEYNFVHYSDKFAYLNTRRLAPFIAGGVDLGLCPSYGNKVAFLPGLTLGAGLKYKIKNRLNLTAMLQGFHYFSDRLDTPNQATASLSNPYGLPYQGVKGGDGRISLSIGLTYEFGLKKTTCFNAYQ